MPHLLRTAIMIVSAMIGSAMVLASLIVIVGNVTIYGSIPADFLPSEQTVAIFHKANQDTIAQWSSHFPALSEVPYGTEAIIGILQNDDSTHSAVIFTESDNPTLGQYDVSFTDATIEPLIKKQSSRVSNIASYKALREKHGINPWVYIKTSALPVPHGLLSTIEHALLYEDDEYISIQEEEDHFRVSKERLHNFISTPLESATLLHTIVKIDSAEPIEVWGLLHELLSAENIMILDGIVRQKLTTWGTNISLDYDIAPLLKAPSTFHMTETGGTINILIEGSMKNTQERDRILDRIHESFASTLPSTTITKRVLDKRFTAVDIRSDKSHIKDSQSRNGDWAIRATQFQNDTHGVASATYKEHFLLSTNREMLDEAIASKNNAIPLSSTGLLRSKGYIDMPALQRFLTPLLPPKDRKTSREDFANTLQWDTIINGLIMQKDLFF